MTENENKELKAELLRLRIQNKLLLEFVRSHVTERELTDWATANQQKLVGDE